MKREWQLQEAKAKFSEVVDRAFHGETQIITKRGEQTVVVIAVKEYERLQAGDKNLLEVFKTAPSMTDEDLPITRDKTPVRAIDL